LTSTLDGQNHTLVILFSGHDTSAHIEKKAGWVPDPVWTFGEELSPLFLLRIEPRCFVFHLVT